MGKSTKHFEDFDLQLSPPTVERLAQYIRDGLAGEDMRFVLDVSKAELMNFATELELRAQRRSLLSSDFASIEQRVAARDDSWLD